MVINRVILLIALLALVNAGLFDNLFGGSVDDEQKKRLERNQKAQLGQKGQRKRPLKPKVEAYSSEKVENEQKEAKDVIKDQEIVDNITLEDDLAKTNLQRHEAWEQHMREFVPDDMLNFMVPGGAALVFHETINH